MADIPKYVLIGRLEGMELRDKSDVKIELREAHNFSSFCKEMLTFKPKRGIIVTKLAL